MDIKLVTGQVYDSVIVEYVLIMKLEAGLSDSEILKDFVQKHFWFGWVKVTGKAEKNGN